MKNRYKNVEGLEHALKSKKTVIYTFSLIATITLIVALIFTLFNKKSHPVQSTVSLTETTIEATREITKETSSETISETTSEVPTTETTNNDIPIDDTNAPFDYVLYDNSVDIHVDSDKLDAFINYKGLNLDYFTSQDNLNICLEIFVNDTNTNIPKEYINHFKSCVDILNIYVNTDNNSYDFSFRLNKTNIKNDFSPYLTLVDTNFEDKLSIKSNYIAFNIDDNFTNLGEVAKISIRSISGTKLTNIFASFYEKYCIDEIAETSDSGDYTIYTYSPDYKGEKGYFSLYEYDRNNLSLLNKNSNWSFDRISSGATSATCEFWDINISNNCLVISAW